MKENDEWWGEGFTEWTPVRKAEPYYPGHNQPRIPLNDNYYNLMNRGTMEWQSSLAEYYGIYGFCFYHYYFKDGRMVMQKPAENLLAWKGISMNFCFSWASAPWVRSWSKFASGTVGGSIASKFEKIEHSGSDILLEQDFGSEEQWEKHFNYLLPFFKDRRYIKIDGKPVFLFHNAENIPCLEDMCDFWRNLAIKNNLKGLYLVATSTELEKSIPGCDALNAQQPQCFFSDFPRYSDDSKKNICIRYNTYEESCKWIRIQDIPKDKKIFLGTFAGYDTTPRHGKKGVVVDAATPELFKESFRYVYQKSIERKNEFVFINAWNEWAEGNYIEPDTKDGYKKLQAVKDVIETSSSDQNLQDKECGKFDRMYYWAFNSKKKDLKKMRIFFKVLNDWMILLEDNISICQYFERNEIKNCAIYENGAFAKHLVAQLKGIVPIRYIIDEQAGNAFGGIPFCQLSQNMPPVDAVIVTSLCSFENIRENLQKHGFVRVIFLNEVIRECMKYRNPS